MAAGKIKTTPPLFETSAISDVADKAEHSKMSIPSEQAVKDAKEWVDFNEK